MGQMHVQRAIEMAGTGCMIVVGPRCCGRTLVTVDPAEESARKVIDSHTGGRGADDVIVTVSSMLGG